MNTEEGPVRWSVRMQHWTKLPKEKLTSKQRVMWGWTWNNAHSWEESEGRGPHVRKHQGQDVSPGGRNCEPSQILKEVPITTPEKCGMGWKSLYTSSKLWGWNPDDNGLKKKKKLTKIEAVKIIYLEMFHGKRESKDRYEYWEIWRWATLWLKFYWNTSLSGSSWLCHGDRAEKLWQRPHDLHSLNHQLPGFLQKQFTGLYSRWSWKYWLWNS